MPHAAGQRPRLIGADAPRAKIAMEDRHEQRPMMPDKGQSNPWQPHGRSFRLTLPGPLVSHLLTRNRWPDNGRPSNAHFPAARLQVRPCRRDSLAAEPKALHALVRTGPITTCRTRGYSGLRTTASMSAPATTSDPLRDLRMPTWTPSPHSLFPHPAVMPPSVCLTAACGHQAGDEGHVPEERVLAQRLRQPREQRQQGAEGREEVV